MEEVNETSVRGGLRKKGDTIQIQNRPNPLRGKPTVRREALVSDDDDLQAEKYRQYWMKMWGDLGSFEDTTDILPMRFTDKLPSLYNCLPCTTVQVFSAKIAVIRRGLQFPLSVYGFIGARDSADWKRIMIFDCRRDSSQIITEEDPYLVLTGPSRAIALLDAVTIEVMLKAKGAVECEDKTLKFQAIELMDCDIMASRMIYGSYTSKLATLELTLGSIVSSMEATLNVRVVDGSLPDAFSVIAYTSSSEDTDHCAIVLGSWDTAVPISDDGSINLSRCVVSVPIRGNLIISLAKSKVVFKARRAGFSSHLLQFPSGTLQVVVAWSSASPLE